MEDLSLHILDIAENSIAAGARTLSIIVNEDPAVDLLSIEITDDGKGMAPELAAQAFDPFTTTRTTRKVGLGLALLKEAANSAHGALTIQSAPNAGTTVRATFQLSHIDTKPLGNMAETITSLLAAHVALDIVYRHTRNGRSIVFDTKAVRLQAGGAPLDTVDALTVIREHLKREEDTLAT